MLEINGIGRILIIVGLVLVSAGIILSFIGKVPWLGRLPGDIFMQKKNFTFYFPITTSLLLSILASLLIVIFRRR